MNPIESYRDAGLDALVTAPASAQRKSSRHSRNASTVPRDAHPPLPASKRGEPTSTLYPGSDSADSGLQRSFSQRARGRPFADAAFADDNLADDVVERSQRRPVSDLPRQPAARQPAPTASSDLPSTSSDRRTSKRQQVIQDNIHAAAKAARPSKDDSFGPMYGDDDVENHPAGLTRAPTMSDAANADKRDWAPDRSPLQKLEVTLHDISKEEKRARVQEAELLHREKSRAQKPASRTVASSHPQTQNGPSSVEDVGVIRSLSNSHKDRLQHSTTRESRKPDAAVLSSNTRGFDYHSAFPPNRSVTITRRSRRTADPDSLSPQARATSSSYLQGPTTTLNPTAPPARSISASYPVAPIPSGAAVPSQEVRSSRQRQIVDSDRTPTSQERNASHRATLERLTGGLGPQPRTDTRSLQADTTPMTRTSAAAGSNELSRAGGAVNPPSFNRTTGLHPQSAPFGLGVQGTPGMHSTDSPAPLDHSGIPTQSKKRRSSVSFKEPYDKRKPVDEWKTAETARLLAADFHLQPDADTTANKAWWEEEAKSRRTSGMHKSAAIERAFTIDDRAAEFKPRLMVKCGPLLRYTGIKRTVGEGAQEYWRGTLLMVTQDSQSSYEKPPTLRLFSQPKSLYTPSHHVPAEGDNSVPEDEDPIAGTTKLSRIGRALYVKPVRNVPASQDLSAVETDDGLFESSPPITNPNDQPVSVAPLVSRLSGDNGEKYGRFKEVRGARLYADPDRDVTFWLFKLEVQLAPEQQHIGYRINNGAASGFWVPATGHTMNIMFHSCNGFSMSVKPDDFSGPDPMWRDVLNVHQSRPFHVMIGGGDQIYNDKVMRDTEHFGEWTLNKNPHYKHNAAFTAEMKEELETFYLENYSHWFSQGFFSVAGAQIPMVNMWDDHDIIDGFGSYPHAFMLSPVFSGVGNVAYKYYMLFQQHSVAAMTSVDEPSWLLGYKPGPYIKQLSRSIFLDLGKHVSFLALDCRTERTKNQVVSLDTCDMALERCRKDIVEGVTRHLIILLGVPIAYPRMNWLENVMTSRAMDPVKALGRYGIIKGGFLNRFDGGVEVLDDLDDHWTAQHHKAERNEFIKELQDLAAERSVRITILGGDVHLGAIGQFYSNPKLKIPKDRDHRYMPNVISSAIVNTPPPEMLADVLNKRNKVHHLDMYTDESMIPMFTHDVDLKKRNNKHLLPRRNWCSITEYIPGRTPPSSRSTSPSRSASASPEMTEEEFQSQRRPSFTKNDLNPRTLFRRLSSRNAQPPNAYRQGDDLESSEPRATSFDEVRAGRSGPSSWTKGLGLQRRTASETRNQESYSHGNSDEALSKRNPPPFRPGFHRRPTNLSEKAVKKGNVPAIDAEGNEFEVNDHVNLDGGLDIVLHCEIDRRNPAGSTEPYRLLVPALWYDGSSDREKLDVAGGLQRRPTLMDRFGLGGRRGHKAAQSQGAGNWGQDANDSDSYTESEEDIGNPPKRSLGFFGSLRKKRYDDDRVEPRNVPDYLDTAASNIPETHNHQQSMNTMPPASYHNQATAPSSTTPKTTPPRTNHPTGLNSHDPPREMYTGSVESSGARFNAPPKRSTSFKATNLLRKNSQKQTSTSNGDGAAKSVPSYSQSGTQQSRPSMSSIDRPRAEISRTNSYTIGSERGNTTQQARQNTRAPIDEDSAYLSTQQRVGSRAFSNPTSTGPSSYPVQSADDLQRNSSFRGSSRGNNSSISKQDQILGIGTEHDTFSGNPQQRSLRGNGILGRFGLGKRSASADRVPQAYDERLSDEPQKRPEFGIDNRTSSQGYSGIEAYREKPKRGLSLKDRARNFLDRVEGKHKEYDDDDDYSYHSSDSYSSENLGETLPGRHVNDRRRVESTKPSASGPAQPTHHDDGMEYSDEGSYLSEFDDRGESAPRRGLSQRLKMGMKRIGSRRGGDVPRRSQPPGNTNTLETDQKYY